MNGYVLKIQGIMQVAINNTKIKIMDFVNFKNSCKKEMRGGKEMYSAEGHYKWPSISELFQYWYKTHVKEKVTN